MLQEFSGQLDELFACLRPSGEHLCRTLLVMSVLILNSSSFMLIYFSLLHKKQISNHSPQLFWALALLLLLSSSFPFPLLPMKASMPAFLSTSVLLTSCCLCSQTSLLSSGLQSWPWLFIISILLFLRTPARGDSQQSPQHFLPVTFFGIFSDSK